MDVKHFKTKKSVGQQQIYLQSLLHSYPKLKYKHPPADKALLCQTSFGALHLISTNIVGFNNPVCKTVDLCKMLVRSLHCID